MTVTIDGPWGMYGYLSNRYPSPFVARGKRWQNVEEFLHENGRSRDVMMLGITQKFRDNIHLLNMLEDLDVDIHSTDNDETASVIMEVRENLIGKDKSSKVESFSRIMTSLTDIIRKNGFTSAKIKGEEVSLIDLEEGVYIIDISGPDEKVGTIDINISDPINDSKIKSIINKYKGKGLKDDYYLIGRFTRSAVARNLAILANVHNIRYFNPNELLINHAAHILSPQITPASPDDPIHRVENNHIPEISGDDPLIKQLNIRRGDIIMVNDFSPHYRRVV
jgi:hypothetical protein